VKVDATAADAVLARRPRAMTEGVIMLAGSGKRHGRATSTSRCTEVLIGV